MQQIEGVEHHAVVIAGELELLGLERGGRHLAHRHALESRFKVSKHVAARAGRIGGAHREFLQPATGRQQADAGLDQTDIAFQREHGFRRVHLEFATTAQRQAAHRRDHWYQRILDALAGGLEVGDHGFELGQLARLQCAQRASEVRAGGERLLVLPDHEAGELLLGTGDRFLQAAQHGVGHGVHLALEADHRDFVALVGPQPHAVVLEYGAALRKPLAEQRIGKALTRVHRLGGARYLGFATRAVAAVGRVHGIAAIEYPVRQRRTAHGVAGHDVLGDPVGHLLPARCLPGLERTERPAVTPADRQVHVAGGVGDAFEVERAVVEGVAEAGPQELRLRMLAAAQRGELLRRILFLQQDGDLGIDFTRRGAVVLHRQVQHQNVLAALGVDAGAGLLAQRAFLDQRCQPPGRLEVRVPRIVGQGVGHGLDDVRHGVQADHVGGAVGRRLRAADRRAGQCIDGVEAEAELLGVVHRGQHREHADAVADEVRGVLGDHHALAQGGGQERFQTFQHGCVGGPGRDQLGQVHVARRVEEMHAAEAVAQLFGQHLGQLVDAQARGVAGQHRVLGNERRDLLVQVLFPVHPLGDRLDDEVAAAQLLQAGVVVGGDQPIAH